MGSSQSRPGGFFSGTAGRGLLVSARLILGFVLIYAGYSKLRWGGQWHLGDYQFLFAISIDSYKMLPIGAVTWMARILPWFEVVLGALLIPGVALRWTGSAAIALLGMFMVALARAAMLHLEICGCYGTNAVDPRTELLYDAGLLALAFLITLRAFLSRRARTAAA